MRLVPCRLPAGIATSLLPLLGCGPTSGNPSPPAPAAATTPAITVADLRTRLFAYADDSMQGRRSGTKGNVKATDLIANYLVEARRSLGRPPERKRAALATSLAVERPNSPVFSSSGAVTSSARSWLAA